MKFPRLISYCSLFLILLMPIALANMSLHGINSVPLSPTAVPTPPPSNDNLLPILREAFSDPNCQLPCFLGLEPGKSTGDELTEFVVNQLGLNEETDIVSPRGATNYQLYLHFDSGALFVNFRGRNNHLYRMNVVLINSQSWLEGYNPFDLNTLLDQLGTPSNIYIGLQTIEPPTAALTLVYEGQGVMVQYAVTLPNVDASTPLSICLHGGNIKRVEAWLQNTAAMPSVLAYLEPAPDAPERFGSNWTIERMAGISIENFIKHFTVNASACIKIPSTRNLYDLGYY